MFDIKNVMENNFESENISLNNKFQSAETTSKEKTSIKLDSREVVEKINKFPDAARDQVVGFLVEYQIIFPDCNNFDSYLEDLMSIEESTYDDSFKLKEKKSDILVKHISKELTEKGLDNSDEAIFAFFAKNYIDNGCYFHSFNQVFESSIKENGLNTEKRLWDWNELDRIDKICSKAGNGMVLGWSNLNCKGKISVTGNPSNIYRYGFASPEWFAQFVAEGLHIPNNESYDKEAYYKKDYESAKNNVTLFCDSMMSSSEEDIKNGKAYPNISSEEKQEILSFFDKYWKIFSSEQGNLKCAIVKKSVFGDTDVGFDTYKDYCDLMEENNLGDNSISIQKCISTCMGILTFNDMQLNEDIKPEDINIINLPNYNDIHPKQKKENWFTRLTKKIH